MFHKWGEDVTRFMKYLEKLETGMMIFGVVTTIVIIFTQVILRYIFNASAAWIEELARYFFIYFTWIGASLAILQDRHLRVEIIFEKFPSSRKYLEVFASLVCLGMTVFMFVNGVMLLQTMRSFSALSPTMKIPMWIFYSAIPLGGLLMSIKYIFKLVVVDFARFRREVSS